MWGSNYYAIMMKLTNQIAGLLCHFFWLSLSFYLQSWAKIKDNLSFFFLYQIKIMQYVYKKPIHIPIRIFYVTLDLYEANQGNAARNFYGLPCSWGPELTFYNYRLKCLTNLRSMWLNSCCMQVMCVLVNAGSCCSGGWDPK